MRFYALPLWLVLSVPLSYAATVPFTRHRYPDASAQLRRRSGRASYSRPVVDAATDSDGSNESSLSTVRDLLYIANATIAGTVYPLQIDTGSSDLWVKGASFPLSNTTLTSQAYNVTYGIGWAYGNVSYATVEFAGVEVQNQAFMDIKVANNPALSYGADGILGLGFDSLSTVDALVNMTDASTGRTFLYNAFAKDKSEPNFISFTLEDTEDSYDSVQGYFSIGEYNPSYTAVANSSKISTWPETAPTRWSILLDYLLLKDSALMPTSVISGVPSGKAVIVLDSGTSYSYVPTDIAQAIYGQVSDASFDEDLGQWIVPCDAEVDIALQFGNHVYPISPLDITPKDSSNSSRCAGTIMPADGIGGTEFDWLIGDNILRSVYAVYDFGDYDSAGKLGNPYIQLLSLVDADQASIDFHKTRGGSAQNITYNSANVTGATSGGSTSVDLSDKLVNTLNTVGNFLPAILALMALNTLLLLGLIGGAIWWILRKRGRSRARRNPGRAEPMPMNTMSTVGLMNSRESHSYQPVSMALTDDMPFTPPTPAFTQPGFEGGGSRLRVSTASSSASPIERPKSVA
ncbi:aspartic peptidase domain-containing protein [Fomitopsis serialis]|uniref:aspartic peptidase domain-containing protein n=1 Tax=Fomitopsis serialis TaxID=139415 RepID=UPI002007D6E9|nr:aspartic peptidase domain-containing protein [Neoantrodia serialis]KAH9938591.1 aspartic peptidase domain-containing protein [Neoantrodia serialis]